MSACHREYQRCVKYENDALEEQHSAHFCLNTENKQTSNLLVKHERQSDCIHVCVSQPIHVTADTGNLGKYEFKHQTFTYSSVVFLNMSYFISGTCNI